MVWACCLTDGGGGGVAPGRGPLMRLTIASTPGSFGIYGVGAAGAGIETDGVENGLASCCLTAGGGNAFDHVIGPTTPSAVRLFELCHFRVADAVAGPKFPSFEIPRNDCQILTSVPV